MHINQIRECLFCIQFQQTQVNQNKIKMKQYFCIGSYVPFDVLNKSQINTSKAKQTFSFSKSKRFTQYKTNCKQLSYARNSFKLQKSGPMMGTSQRIPITMPHEGPSPSHYRIKTDMFKDIPNITFGKGRQIVKANGYLNIESSKYPPSTKYEIQKHIQEIYQKSPSFSMKKRYATQIFQNINSFTPGPAKYNVLTGKNHNLQLTKYKSISFSASKARRFENQQTQPPGPGTYNKVVGQQSQRIGGGSSKFKHSTYYKFPNQKRKTYIDDEVKRRVSLPGPGNYKTSSDFGQYDGNVYQMFELSSPSNLKQIKQRPDTANNLNINSKINQRPSTANK